MVLFLGWFESCPRQLFFLGNTNPGCCLLAWPSLFAFETSGRQNLSDHVHKSRVGGERVSISGEKLEESPRTMHLYTPYEQSQGVVGLLGTFRRRFSGAVKTRPYQLQKQHDTTDTEIQTYKTLGTRCRFGDTSNSGSSTTMPPFWNPHVKATALPPPQNPFAMWVCATLAPPPPSNLLITRAPWKKRVCDYSLVVLT